MWLGSSSFTTPLCTNNHGTVLYWLGWFGKLTKNKKAGALPDIFKTSLYPHLRCDSARETAWVFYRGNTYLIVLSGFIYYRNAGLKQFILIQSSTLTEYYCNCLFGNAIPPLPLMCTTPITAHTADFKPPPSTPVGQCANSFLSKTSLDYLLKISLDISWFSTQHSRMKVNAENCTKEDDFYLQTKNVAYLKVYLLIFMRHVLSKHKSPSRGPQKVERSPRTNIWPCIPNTECFAVSI